MIFLKTEEKTLADYWNGRNQFLRARIHLQKKSTLIINCIFICNGNAKSRPNAVMEHLVGRRGQPRGAQVHARALSDWKGGARIQPFPALI